MTTYHVTVERGDRFWLVYVSEVDRWTQTRTLREVDEMARDLVAVMEDIEPDSFDIDVSVTLPSPAADHLAKADALREQAQQAQHEAATEIRVAARQLSERGLSLRDLGMALGVSYQRAHQLVKL